MIKGRKQTHLIALILILTALISFFALSKVYSDPDTFSKTVAVLDEEKNTVAKLSAVSFAAAAAIDLIPGDAGKSVSEALVDLGGYFVLIFAAIYLEKILLAIGGSAAFKVLIPLGCILIALFIELKQEPLKKIGVKLITFGLIVFLLVPTSVWISQKVEDMYTAANGTSMQDTIESLDSETKTINEAVGKDDGNVVQKLIGKVKTVVTSSLDKFNELLDNAIEMVAFFIVMNCVLPIAVLLLLILLLNQITGANIDVGAVMRAPLAAKRKVKSLAADTDTEE